MSMSSCEKCWDCPCSCGWGYRDWSEDELSAQIEMLQKVKERLRKANESGSLNANNE